MYSINRATVSPLNIINTSGESANVDTHPKTSGFDEIFNRTMQDLANPKTVSDSAAELKLDKKAAPKEEIQSIEAKESLQAAPERTDRQAHDIRSDRDRPESDKSNAAKDSVSVKDQEKTQKNAETAVKIEVKKDKPAEPEKNAKKDRTPMPRDIEKFLADITAAIDKINAQTKSPVMMNDLAKIKEDLRDIVTSDKKGPRLQAAIDSLKDKISLFEMRHAMSLNADDRAQIATIKTAMHDLKKIQPEKEHRQAPAATEAFHDKNAVLPEKTVVSKENASGEQGRGDAKQNAQWNISALKSNFERQAERAAQEKPADTSRFRAQLDAIIDKARVVVHDSKNATFSLRLHPKELGGLHINLGLEHGVLHGRFLVETPEAKNLLLQNLELVRQELAQSGLSLGEFQVNVRGQREEYQSGMPDKGKRPDVQLKEISAEYATNTLMGHEGSINLII